ncbi:hypothetical protein E8E15_010721 [Penicillium rubens]|uniref:Pc21g04550 protein n=1 Tax=Penicillium rubens (strain ATCC 28089 / DSM 1075 / NRRL 1951 / Wisconsin 54-1255) TaxID=500485 RepID=B6HMN6_PENRW|nr:uncharacterized protein N7525_006940 [Penicillium rubens]CAP95352.1 Pc21g04550 [Penicillium rubens Wisconsin 54-1255]KAF3028280.1 hypothetical protein E8E15_010721 [Penicillium rubens]KAJ5049649.1 hypothetical protein NUH16_008168 [Penicillium rubens]KAJ5828687.1 hypothetical protein N7525_006940 [Penicillium rubens]KAJ5841611.1 hypothetical protein N7534_011441 [Penicillium rubens]
MRVLPQGLGKAKPSFLLLLLLVIAIAVQVSAVPADDTTTDTGAAKTTDDPSTTQSISSVSETTTSSTTSKSTSSSTTSTSSSSSSTTTTMDTTTTSSSSSSSTTSDSSTTTSSVSTTTTSSTSSSSSSTTTTTGGAIVTIPPTANAPYMQESNAPEGTVFIAVGAALGLVGLTLLAWRAMVAWSVNRSVRRAAVIHASESKRLLRGSRKKRSTPYSASPAVDVSLDKLGAATRASYKPNRVPSASSGLFFSPTAGGPTGSHASLNATGSTGNRGSTYLPAGYYAAAGSSNPAPSGELPYSPTAGLSSPSLPPTGVYHDSHNQRHSHVGASTSSLNLNQAPQGRAPSAYLEDLFESHAPHSSDSGRR